MVIVVKQYLNFIIYICHKINYIDYLFLMFLNLKYYERQIKWLNGVFALKYSFKTTKSDGNISAVLKKGYKKLGIF
jgi:hypothetical protein